MKKVLAITCLLMLMLCIASSAFATDLAWRLKIKADNGAGSYAAASLTVGVATNTTDGVDLAAGTDVVANYGVDTTLAAKWVVALIPSDARTWIASIASNAQPDAYPGDVKSVWELRVAPGPSSGDSPIRLQFYTVGATVMPPTPKLGGYDVSYRIRMGNNRGVVGAPAPGTIWVLPVPAAHQALPFYFITLPDMLNLPSYSHENMINLGYQLWFEQVQIVPEPGGLLALGAGLMGLAGFAFKRRKG